MSRRSLVPLALVLAACSPQQGGEVASPDVSISAGSGADAPAAVPAGPVEVENISGQSEAATWETVFDDGLSQYPGLYEYVRAASEAAMREMSEAAARDHANWQEDGAQWEWRPYDIGWTWEIVWSDETRVSVLQSWYEYTGGAHPNHGSGSVLWLVPEQRTVGLSELFEDGSEGSPAMTALLDAIRASLIEQKSQRLGEYFNADDQGMWLGDLTASAESFGAFTLALSTEPERAGGLIFHFDPYAVGAYAEGDYRVLVPQSLFRADLSADWRGVFAGEPDVSPEDLEP
ncbi:MULTISPECIES: DUF3298 and DUF4163 domain-containing protein [Hyphobacterium]|uniref:DUF3298 domain-containing protein n=1 Tax=Hyphobacterium vulgare TaxID=1736751 RepID=A0ABV6ZWM4_9PROT